MVGGICACDSYVPGMFTLSLPAPAAHELEKCDAMLSFQGQQEAYPSFPSRQRRGPSAYLESVLSLLPCMGSCMVSGCRLSSTSSEEVMAQPLGQV